MRCRSGLPARPEVAPGHLDRRPRSPPHRNCRRTRCRRRSCATSRSASRSSSGIWNRLETCQSLPGLLGQRRHQMRMGVAQPGHRDAGAEVEHAAAVGGVEPGALAAREGEVVAPVDRQQRGDGLVVHAIRSVRGEAGRVPQRAPALSTNGDGRSLSPRQRSGRPKAACHGSVVVAPLEADAGLGLVVDGAADREVGGEVDLDARLAGAVGDPALDLEIDLVGDVLADPGGGLLSGLAILRRWSPCSARRACRGPTRAGTW